LGDAGGKILGAATNSMSVLDSLKGFLRPLTIIDIVIVAIVIYWIYLFLKETRAMRILYGLFFLLAIMAVGRILNLTLLNWILQYFMAMLVVAIPIVFQPELRTALERLGRTKFLSDSIFGKGSFSKIIDEVMLAVSILAKQKIGALIIIQRQTGLREYIEKGTPVEANVSKDILLSIFYPKSPLHDGAVIIVDDKIVSARSVLPVSENYVNSSYGTRHKAALGITEDSDALAVVVSEESGIVSLAVGGKIERRIPEDRLRNRLIALMRQNKTNIE
jgi:diadenylate cyclase